MEVAIIGFVHDKYWETEWFVKSCKQLYPKFDTFIFCNADAEKLKHLDCKVIQSPDEKTFKNPNVPGKGYEYYFQMGAVTNMCFAEEYIKKLNYDYVIYIPTDCIFVTDILLDHLQEMEKYKYDFMMGEWLGESYGACIKKGSINIFSFDNMFKNFSFNGEKTVTRLVRSYNVNYKHMVCKFGYFDVYGTVHSDTNIPGGKDIYLKYMQDDKLVFTGDKTKPIPEYDFENFARQDDWGKKQFIKTYGEIV